MLDSAPSLRSGVVEAVAPTTTLQPSMAMRQLYRKVGLGQGTLFDGVADDVQRLGQRVLDGAIIGCYAREVEVYPFFFMRPMHTFFAA